MSIKLTLPKMAALSFLLGGASALACDFTPDPDGFNFSFTGHGKPDRSYQVTGNTFKKYDLASESGKLLNATIDIDATSLDTSHDINNGMGGEWQAGIPEVRNGNIINGLFNNFKDPGKIYGKIAAITPEEIQLALTMNEVTATIAMAYTVENGVLTATGKIEDVVADFDAKTAWTAFNALCQGPWHGGKTWHDVDLTFSVPVAEASCQ